MPVYYTPSQAAPLLNLKPRSIRKFIERGMISAEKRDGAWYISQEEIDRYNRERRPAHGLAGRVVSEETRAKLRAIKTANPPMKGKKHTDEARAKMSAFQSQQPRGPDSPSWKGGRPHDRHGYILVYMPEHPYAVGPYVLEHRIVMEQVLGRYLTPDEEVHHKNGIITDNRTENLEVLTKSEHSRFHRLNPHIKSRRS